MKKLFLYSILFVFASACLYAGEENSEVVSFPPPGYEGIHQLQTEQHKNYVKPMSERPPQGLKPIPLAPQAPGVNRLVVGYIPYWQDTNTNVDWLRYNLITHLIWHAVTLNSDGTISNPNGWPNTYLINKAHTNGTKVLLSATNFASGATFLANATARYTACTALLEMVSSAGADGVGIDIEAMTNNATNKANLSTFMYELSTTFKNANSNYDVTIDIEPLNGVFDLNALSDSCDFLFFMWYNFYYSGSASTGPVAPLSRGGYYSSSFSQLSKINSYISSNGFRLDKIVMGYPLYGLRWNTSSPAAHASVSSYVSSPAVGGISYSGAVVNWDTASQTPWIYTGSAGSYTQTWYETPESLGYKYDLVNNLGLGGVGFWAFAYDYSSTQYWDILSTKFFGVSTAAQGIKNGTFDITRNWPNWEFSNGSISISTGTTYYAGGRAAAVTQTSGSGAAFYQTDGRVQIGQQWTTDAWLYQNGFATGSCNWGWAGSYSPYIKSPSNAIVTTGGGWKHYYVTETFTGSTGWRDVQATLTGAGTVYIDEVQVYAGVPVPVELSNFEAIKEE